MQLNIFKNKIIHKLFLMTNGKNKDLEDILINQITFLIILNILFNA